MIATAGLTALAMLGLACIAGALAATVDSLWAARQDRRETSRSGYHPYS